MFRKINNKFLGIMFAIFLLAASLIYFVDGGKTERTFRHTLVNIDTTAVTEVLIYPKNKEQGEVKLFKEEGIWKIALGGNKTANVTPKRITDLFQQLEQIKPLRLAARGEEKWNEFQVDTSGSRVIVKEGNKTSLDIVLGRFIFQQPRSMSTYVRLYRDSDVYVVDGFLDMTFNQGPEIFRDGTIINDDYSRWTQLRFSYPDSSFTLAKAGNDWLVNGVKADSAKTINYLSRLARMSDMKFVDDFVPSNLLTSTYKLSITTDDLSFIEVKGFKEDEHYVIHSSQNPETFFDGSTAGVNIFVGKSSFTPN